MKYIPEFLQDAMEDGIEIGVLKIARTTVTDILKLRFPSAADELTWSVQEIDDVDLLRTLLLQIVTVGSVDEVTMLINEQVRQPA